jgi:hypothetical protein
MNENSLNINKNIQDKKVTAQCKNNCMYVYIYTGTGNKDTEKRVCSFQSNKILCFPLADWSGAGVVCPGLWVR